MSQKTPKLELTDICDEMNEDLRRELIKNQRICFSKVETILLNIDLKDEIKRLESDLMFANNCLKTFNKYKEYLNEIRPKIENVLNFKEKQKLNDFEIQYKNMFKKFNERNQRIGEKGMVSMDKQPLNVDNRGDHNYYIKANISESDESSNTDYFEDTNSEVMSDLENSNNSSDDSIIESEVRNKNKRTEEPEVHNNDILSEIVRHIDISNERTEQEVHPLSESQNNSQTSVENQVLNKKVSQKEIERKEKEKKIITEKLKCPVNGCDSEFWYKGDLFKHLVYTQVHVNLAFDANLKYGCKECSFRCDSLKWHIYHRRAHQTKCRFCSKEFKNISTMNNHLRDVHSTTNEFKCSVGGCERSFSNEFFKVRHMKIKHKISSDLLDELVVPEWLRKRENTQSRHETLKKKVTKRITRKKYSCDFVGCNYVTQYITRLSAHKYNHKKYPNINYKCDYCDYSSIRHSDLRSHIKVKHSNEPRFKCKSCDKAYKTYGSLECHNKQKHKTHKCRHCEEVFNSPVLRRKHENKVHLLINCCTFGGCDFVGRNSTDLTKHNLSHTGEKPFKCDWPDCDFKARNKFVITNHKYKHTGELPHSCPHCGKKFRTLNPLKEHIKYNHKSNESKKETNISYVCDYVDCNYVTDKLSCFKTHKSVHQKYPNKNHKCSFCEFTAFRLKDLNQHLNEKHSNELRFKCNKCEKAYKTAASLCTHKRDKHRDVFRCLYCEEVFTSQIKRKVHMNEVHTRENCCTWPGCSYVALNPARLRQHTYIHNRESTIVCDWPDCGFMAKTNYELKHHKYIHTGEQPYACNWPGCDKRFRIRNGLKEHLRMHNRDLRYACDWPGCQFRSYNMSIIRNHKYYRHTSKMELK